MSKHRFAWLSRSAKHDGSPLALATVDTLYIARYTPTRECGNPGVVVEEHPINESLAAFIGYSEARIVGCDATLLHGIVDYLLAKKEKADEETSS